MAEIINKPTRMCIACRTKDIQDVFLRLHCKDGDIQSYTGSGRSFYLCNQCLEDEKKTAKALMRQCRTSNKDKLMIKLKEIITDE